MTASLQNWKGAGEIQGIDQNTVLYILKENINYPVSNARG